MAKHPRRSSNPHRSARLSAAQPPSPAATAVRDLAIAGRHEQAVAAATAALADPRLAPAARLALLEARLDSLLWGGFAFAACGTAPKHKQPNATAR